MGLDFNGLPTQKGRKSANSVKNQIAGKYSGVAGIVVMPVEKKGGARRMIFTPNAVEMLDVVKNDKVAFAHQGDALYLGVLDSPDAAPSSYNVYENYTYGIFFKDSRAHNFLQKRYNQDSEEFCIEVAPVEDQKGVISLGDITSAKENTSSENIADVVEPESNEEETADEVAEAEADAYKDEEGSW